MPPDASDEVMPLMTNEIYHANYDHDIESW